MAPYKFNRSVTKLQGRAINQYFNKNNMTIKELSGFLEINSGNLSKILSGVRPMPFSLSERIFEYLDKPKELGFLSHYNLVGNENWHPEVNLTEALGYGNSDLETLMKEIEKKCNQLPENGIDDFIGDLYQVLEFYSNSDL